MKLSISDSDLTEEQKWGIDAFVNWYRNGTKYGFQDHPTFTLSGPAGSGKSTIAEFALQAVGLSGSSSNVSKVAYTGKAAMVMRSKGLEGASTIHSAIYLPTDDAGKEVKRLRAAILKLRGSMSGMDAAARAVVTEEIQFLMDSIAEISNQAEDDLAWIRNPCSAVGFADLVLCDEGSMVGGRVQSDLESYGTPVLYLGDEHQLAPILDQGEGSVFFDERGRVREADFKLTQIHRQAENSPILRYSRALRENRIDEINFFGKQTGDGTLIRIPGDRLGIEHYARAGQIICGMNATRHAINREVRAHLGRKGAYPEAGDKLIFLKNNQKAGVFNGMTATAASSYYDFNSKANCFTVDVEMDDGVTKPVSMLVPPFQSSGDNDAIFRDAPSWSRKKNIWADYGFAITAHKSQGSQYESGIVLEEPIGDTYEDRRRWLYTAVTRFSQGLILAAPN